MTDPDRRFQAIVQHAAVGIVVADPGGRMLEVNGAFHRMLGYPEPALRGRTVEELTYPDDRGVALGLYRELVAGERASYEVEKRYLASDGTPVWGRVSASALRAEDGSPELVVAVVQDIDARRRAEEALREAGARYRTLVEELPLVTYIDALDERSSNIYTSPQLEPILGYPASEWQSDPDLFVKLIHPDDRERVLAEVAAANASGERFVSEYRLLARDGRVVWFRDECVVVRDHDGNPLYSQGYLLDITERKLAEEALRASEERFRRMADDAPVLVWTTDATGAVTFFSKTWLDLVGRPFDEEVGFGWIESVHPDDLGVAVDAYREAIAAGRPWEAEYRLRRADGAYRWIFDRGKPQLSPGGEVIGYVGVGVDVTERREAEDALRRREAVLEAVGVMADRLLQAPSWRELGFLEPLAQALGAGRACVFEYRAEPGEEPVNELAAEWTAPGVRPLVDDPAFSRIPVSASAYVRLRELLARGEAVNAPVSELAPPERARLEAAGVRSLLCAPVLVAGELHGVVVLHDVERERRWSDAEVDGLRAAAGILGGAIQRDGALRSLQETGETLEAVVAASPAAIYGCDREGKVILWNRAAEAMFGWSAEEALGRVTPFVDEGDLPEFRSFLERALRGESWNNVELRRLRRDGARIDISASSAPLRNADGEIVGLASVIVDITEEKRIRDALRESEARFAAFMDNAQAVAFMKDEQGRYVYANEPLVRAFALSREELIGKTDFEILPEESAREFTRTDDMVRAGGQAVERLEKAVLPDGEPIWYLALKFPFEDASGRRYVGGVSLDVTERERARQALAQTTEKLESLVANAPLAIVTSDLDGVVTGWNPAAERMFGWTAEEALGRPPAHFLPHDPEGLESRERAARGEIVSDAEARRVRKDGAILDVRYGKAPLYDANGEVAGTMAMLTDVTERMRAETRLAAQHAVSRVLAASATLEDAAPLVLDAAREGLGWDVGALWLVDGDVLRPAEVRAGDASFAPFVEATRDTELARGVGLPGRVWEAREPQWVVDVPAATSSGRGGAVAATRIVSAIAVPVEAGGELVGVVEFFARAAREPDEDMVAMLTSVGRQLGQFLRRVEADAAVREREERFRTLVANLPGAVYRCAADEHWTMEYLSDAIVDICGYPASDFVRNRVRSYASVIHEDDRARVAAAVAEAIRERRPFELDYRVVHADGSIRWVQEKGQPMLGPAAVVVSLDGAVFDVTQQKRAQDELAQAKAFLDSVVESLPTPLFLKEASELRFVRVNRAVEELWGIPREELVGKNDLDFFPPEQAREYMRVDREVLERQELLDVPDEPIETRTQGTRYLHTRKVPIAGEGGRSEYVLGLSLDVTEQKQAAAERERLLAAEKLALEQAEAARAQLAAQNETLRELDRLKDEFVALVSHELRTPLTSILGYLELLVEGEVGTITPEQASFLSIIERNAQRLLRLVGDLLFVAQIEAGKLAFERDAVDLLQVAVDCLEAARPRAAEKSIELVLEGSAVPCLVGDRVRLSQLLDNLVSNAIKFTPPGGRVLVSCTHAQDRVALAVSDTGMGIPRAEQHRLFQRFFRSSSAVAAAIQGTGLGLTITKAIAEAHGGSVAVESEEGRGTTFLVHLPLPDEPTGSTSAAPAPMEVEGGSRR